MDGIFFKLWYINGRGFLSYDISMGGDFKAIIYQRVGIFKIWYTDGLGFLTYDISMGGDF